MEKKYALFTALIFVSSMGFSQNLSKFHKEKAVPKLTEQTDPVIILGGSQKIKKQKTKIPGTVLYSETFANQIPAGWTVTNNAGNSNNWIWSNTAPGGQYSTNTAAVNSTTAANGFMSLPSDLYNTPFPAGGPLDMDTWFTSPAITIPATASVLLKFEQSNRYCCRAADELVVEVSFDNITWTTYDALLGRSFNTPAPSTSSDPAEIVTLNVSADLANKTTAYLRFRQTGASHYYWMVDDVELIEGAANAMEILDWSINFSDTSINPVMSMVPSLALEPLTFDVVTFNAGSNTQTAVDFVVDIIHDSSWFTAPAGGMGVLTTMNTLYGIPIPTLQIDTVRTGTFVNLIEGYMRAVFTVNSAQVNQNPAGATVTGSFVVTDTVLAKDIGPYTGSIGPGGYAGGGNDGDRWASLMTVGSHPNGPPSTPCYSISILVGNNAANDGASIGPRIWYWNDTAANIAAALGATPIGSSPFSTTIDTTMLGNWITLPIFPPAVIESGKQYAVGWEQTGGATSGAEFTCARDVGVEARQPAVSNFVFINNATPTWFWAGDVGAIRLNLGDLLVGVDEIVIETASFSISPNPNIGIFKVNISNNKSASYELDVRNMLGQTVYSDNINVKGEISKTLDLTKLEKGVYFVSITNGSERQVKKVVIN